MMEELEVFGYSIGGVIIFITAFLGGVSLGAVLSAMDERDYKFAVFWGCMFMSFIVLAILVIIIK